MRVEGSGFRVQGSGFRVQGSGFRVQMALARGREAVGETWLRDKALNMMSLGFRDEGL